MLQEITCSIFIKSPIKFSKGLNVILGDNLSTNSIGKSTFLMILDFIFGGSSYISKNSGSIKELDHHSFSYKFIFQGEPYYFARATANPEIIYICNEKYEPIEEQKLSNYNDFLKKQYKTPDNLSFRSTVNTYSRIWGKDNYNVDKPLQGFIKEAESVAVNNIIKLFELYESIQEISKQIKEQEDSKKILAGIHRKNYIPKVTKTQFKKNEIEIERIDKNIQDIKDNILKLTLNIEELAGKEIIEIKTQKKKLLNARSLTQNKIRRLNLNLESKGVKSKYFEKLSLFFENPNLKKIKEIETFHTKISTIVSKEIKSALKVLKEEEDLLTIQIDELDQKISKLLKDIESPNFIVEKIYDLTIESNALKTNNKYYTENEKVKGELKKLSISLEDKIKDIIESIESQINNELILLNTSIHSKRKKIPKLKLNTKSYTFDHSSNTGTGKSFSDLIEFDLAILKLTKLPFIIHDSILFKNIEDFTVDAIVKQYLKFRKQIFISLDGISKYDKNTIKILSENSVLELSETEKLFNRDWR